MKQIQKNQLGQPTKMVVKQNKRIAGSNTYKIIRKKDNVLSGEEPTTPTTPDIPATPDIPTTPQTPGREYEDPGHEHVYHPPVDNISINNKRFLLK